MIAITDPAREPGPAVPPLPCGVYCHIPFCAHRCDFCAFYEEAPRRSQIEEYLQAMERELSEVHFPQPVETVFWGGGTPGLLPAKDLQRLGRALLARLPGPPREWTVELSPSVIKPDKLEVLAELGVNRLSLGVQSFRSETLQALGREYTPDQVFRSITTIRRVGRFSLNLDLIFAVPGQSPEQWREDLEMALAQEPDHLSTYCLTFEEDTALWVKLRKGGLQPASEDDEAAFYEISRQLLESAGMQQYEISNFALPGKACRHNLNTWNMAEWRGFGPSASSQWEGRRFTQVQNLEAWAAGVRSGHPIYQEEQILTARQLAEDALIFGLRRNAGVDLERWARRFAIPLTPALAELFLFWQDHGLLEYQPGGIIRLTDAGRLLADRMGREIMQKFSCGAL